MYRYQAKLVFKQYIPKQLEFGMLFIMFVEGKPQLITMSDRWYTDESVINQYGYPVELYIVEEEDYNDTIAEPQDIGWLDYGGKSFKPFTIKEANHVLMEYDGLLEIWIMEDPFDEDEQIIPAYSDQKIIINYLKENDEEI